MKLTTILDGYLYQRGNTLGWKSIEALQENNIQTVVCMVKRWDPPVKRWLESNGGMYIYCPIPDSKNLNKQMLLALGTTVSRRALLAPVLVHCAAGRNRSALVNALAMRELLDISGARAMERMREARPNALANEHFASWLESLPAPNEEE